MKIDFREFLNMLNSTELTRNDSYFQWKAELVEPKSTIVCVCCGYGWIEFVYYKTDKDWKFCLSDWYIEDQADLDTDGYALQSWFKAIVMLADHTINKFVKFIEEDEVEIIQ